MYDKIHPLYLKTMMSHTTAVKSGMTGGNHLSAGQTPQLGSFVNPPPPKIKQKKLGVSVQDR